MKKTLLFTALFAASFGFSQTELIQNGSADDFSVAEVKINDIKEVRGNTGDNADAWDMTPNSTVILNAAAETAAGSQMSGVEGDLGVSSDSPYTWNNSDLEDWLEVFYLGEAGSLDEQPGSTSSGNESRGIKLYMDTSPNLPGESTRRLYQKVEGLTVGSTYVFSVESRSELMNTPSEVYMLNTEITDELGINANGSSDSSVDGFMSITNDFDTWTANELTFTATNTYVVVYVRSLGSVDTATEVFYDNFSLIEDTTASTEDVFASKLSVYPNPASVTVTINAADVELTSVQVFNMLGKQVYASANTASIDVSSFAKGVYFLKLNGEGTSATKKLIVE